MIRATVPSGALTGPMGIGVDGVVSAHWNFFITTTVHITDSLGNTGSYTSEQLGGTWFRLTSTGSGCTSCTVPGNISNNLDWDGKILSNTDELGHVTTFIYDANNNTASVSQPLDSTTTATTSYTYNSFGEPLTVTDPLGNVTTNTYDANGNLLTVTSPAPNGSTAASVTQFAYDTKGELTQITDPLGNLTKLAYNAVGLISTITDAQQNVTTYSYDQHGNRTSVTDALNNTTAFAYDAGDRLTKITYQDQSSVSFGYDYHGRRTSVTDQNGKTTTYAYDDADRLTSVTDAAQNVTAYVYDTENNLLSITDADSGSAYRRSNPWGAAKSQGGVGDRSRGRGFCGLSCSGARTGTGSSDYIQLYHSDANLLKESLEVGQRTASVMLGALSPEDAQDGNPRAIWCDKVGLK